MTKLTTEYARSLFSDLANSKKYRKVEHTADGVRVYRDHSVHTTQTEFINTVHTKLEQIGFCYHMSKSTTALYKDKKNHIMIQLIN